jgi:DNA-binding transcriptional MerR regulator
VTREGRGILRRGFVADTRATIPDRELFKAAEVCEIAAVQPYVLRSWEMEFPSIGTSRQPGGPRVYRRRDVERILLIKQLVFSEGLTLAGARRRLEEEAGAPEAAAPAAVVDAGARETLDGIKDGLRSLLTMLGEAGPKQRGAWPPSGQPALLEFEPPGAGAATPAAGAKKGSRRKIARR